MRVSDYFVYWVGGYLMVCFEEYFKDQMGYVIFVFKYCVDFNYIQFVIFLLWCNLLKNEVF